ncbi:MAG: hypothetical protein CBC95_006535 [Crocinitomicaceae bacterium TMED135]|nr:MAG: hypothetical protein CBC95_006535 [Crocinitomicaceae bacterium TMED135]
MKKYLFITFSIITFLSCSSSKESRNPTVIIDPNPTSEMARLMREMTIELDEIKIRLEKNETLENNLLDFALIHEAEVTDISFNKPHIIPMSKAFHYVVNEFNKEPNIINYNIVVNNCVSCHQLSCQGPLIKINKLTIKN